MDLLDRLLGHDTWATGQLLEISRGLPDEALDQQFDLGHRTLRRTFAHIIRNTQVWTDLMLARDVRQPLPFPPTLEFLIHEHSAASHDLLRLARSISNAGQLDDTFLDVLDHPPRAKTFGGTIVHLATHGMHHRAQLRIMLRQLGVGELPELDALEWEMSQPAHGNAPGS